MTSQGLLPCKTTAVPTALVRPPTSSSTRPTARMAASSCGRWSRIGVAYSGTAGSSKVPLRISSDG
ncbi:hypothetical protein [Nannocystis pusilla]|uniref:hypothetical protein n=1 Tax=Nannocystis pusilla TaxID=889268 RepID=UPI003DA5BAAB